MKKNGFTLIELLAVIVILAIIALIATPIILGIINDAREESNERSVELYASAVRNAVAAYQLKGTNAPTLFEDLDIQYEGNVECSVEKLYEDGSFYLEGCKVNGSEKEYNYGTKRKVTLESICELASDSTKTGTVPGAKYECKVDPSKPVYTFYVLNSTETSVTLMMEGNINSDGTLATTAISKSGDNVYNMVEWLTEADYILAGGVVTEEMKTDDAHCQHGGACYNTSFGPITALKFLEIATAGWTNLDLISIDTAKKEYKLYARIPSNADFANLTIPEGSHIVQEYPEFWGDFGYWLSDVDGELHVYSHDFDLSQPGYPHHTSGIRPVISLSL